MQLIHMRPEELRKAVEANVPALVASGVVEYHGPHLPVGTDFVLVQRICEEIERRCRCVLAPPLPLGPTGSWAWGAREGEVDFPPETFFAYAKALLRGLLDLGFRRIYVVQFHQGLEGVQALCLRRAAAELALEDGRAHGAGWGRRPPEVGPGPAVFKRIHVAGPGTFLPPEFGGIPTRHAGRGETQLMMAAAPETVKMAALPADASALPHWLHDACEADPTEGRWWFEKCVDTWVAVLRGAR